jgi:undecaprenyl-diphosphatase
MLRRGVYLDSAILAFFNNLDAEVVIFIQKTLGNPISDNVFLTFTDLHKQLWFQLAVILPLLAWWVWQEKRQGFIRLLGLIFTLIMIDGFCGQFIKKVFARPRPFVSFPEILQKSPASGFSFVSNHSANMVGLAVFMSHFYPRWKYLWWSLAILIGLSRIYNGVHFLSDVIVGGLIGGIIAWAATRWLDRRIKTERI